MVPTKIAQPFSFQLQLNKSGRDIIENLPDWNTLIGKKPWNKDDVAAFQKLIDLRTITIYEQLLIAGGLTDFVTEWPVAQGGVLRDGVAV